MSPAQADRLGAKIERMLAAAAPAATADINRQSARALAAIAIADRLPDHGESLLKLSSTSGGGEISPSGCLPASLRFRASKAYALFEVPARGPR